MSTGDTYRPIGPQDRLIVDSSGNLVGIQSPNANSQDMRVLTPSQLTAAQALVSGAWKATSALQYDALYRWYGAAQGGTSYGQTASLSATLFTIGCKMEIEAPFSAVRLMWVNRANNAITGNKALVGVTETAATDTSNNRSVPVLGGTAYPVVAGGTSVNGFRSPTWAGSATMTVPAATTVQQFVLSDLTPLNSVDRADGGTRPLLQYRMMHDGATQGNWAYVLSPTGPRTPTPTMYNRIIQTTGNISDYIATPGGTMNLDTTWMEVYPIVRHKVPVLSVWSVGDSITQNDGLVTDVISSWGLRACLSISTPTRPVVHANFGVSSRSSPEYLATARAALAAGVPRPGVLVVSAMSVNDLTAAPNPRIAETIRNAQFEAVQLAKDYAIPAVVMWPILPNENLSPADDLVRKALNVEAKAVAQSLGITWLDLSALGDGASPERYVAAYKFDNIHPNELAVQTVMAPALAAVLQRFFS